MTNRLTFSNPIAAQAADPWVYRHTDGFYYFMCTKGDVLQLLRSPRLTTIADGDSRTVWRPEPGGRHSHHLWAPEIHFLNGCWYIYYTANDSGGDDTRQVCVLENAGPDPMEGEWTWRGALPTPAPGLDGSVLELGGKLYFLYAGYGHFPDYGSAVYIMRMDNPYTLRDRQHVLLTAQTLDWEKQGGMAINEGPVILRRNGRVFLVYSASTTWSEDYCLGMLTLDERSDPMSPESWSKSPWPVFRKNIAASVFAVGHNSFTVSPDGQEDWIVFHALSAPGEDTAYRATRIQKFGWNADGSPDFGSPLGSDQPSDLPSGE